MATTPEQCALDGFSPASEARVVASHQVGRYAVMYVQIKASPGYGDLIVFAEEDGWTWHELSSGSAGWTWTALPDADDDGGQAGGLLGLVGDLHSPGTVTVELDGSTLELHARKPHWAALFVGVDVDALHRVQVSGPSA